MKMKAKMPANGAIKQVLLSHQKDLGGFIVRRVLPSREQRAIGPWVFFDHMGPADFSAGKGVDVRPHPHINLATVTYLFAGNILHRDSLGNAQIISPGEINLMVAGKGIVHSERTPPATRNHAHTLNGLQLWLALPEAQEEMEPAFYNFPAADIPQTEVDGVTVRVMLGAAYGVKSPVPIYAETLYLEVSMQDGQSLPLPQPALAEAAIYLESGRIKIDDKELAVGQMAVLNPAKTTLKVSALQQSRFVMIGGESVGKRHMEWNFVSSRKERIEQAISNWRSGNFPKVPGDDKEYIPY